MDNPTRPEWSIEDVAASNHSFEASLRARNLEATADAYTPDATLLAPSSDLFQGRNAIAEFWRAGVDAGVADASFDPVSLERSDGIAYELGRYTLKLQPAEGGEVFDHGSYVVVHRRDPDGKWRRALEMLSPDGRR
jgi:ketosteroid isomerase-like protein